jgi:mannose/cellobiose epimerase-like protein (N-acyl-D-glucosamine 2-epimerase family)
MNKIVTLLIIACLFIGCRPKMENSLGSTSKDQTDWIYHVDSLLMPFWMSNEALGNPPGKYPAYRYPDGSAIDPTNLDYTILVPEYQQFYMENTDSLRRDFIRVKSRQIYGYCIAFHLTGNEKYLENAKLGLDFLIDNGAYKDGSIVSFWDKEGNPKPDIYQRNSQDLAYGLLGPSIYYYLTRDPSILKIILETNRFYWNAYYEKSELRENTKLFAWVLKDFEGDSIQNKRLIAPLDQLNAYTLLTAQIVPDSLSAEFEEKVKVLANSIKDNFYSEKYNIFWSRLNNKEFGGNTDFAHSIKTFWMLYVSAKTYGDRTMENFAFNGAQKLLKSAYLKNEGRWASNYLDESLELDKSLFAWHCSELDQMAATLSFKDTTFYSKYLKQTFPYFEKNMIDSENKSTYWGRSAEGNIIEIGFRSGWHISNFHDMERALIGYLSTANYYGDDIKLYYAFNKNNTPENTIIKPYYYDAEIKELNKYKFNNPILSNLVKYHVIFDKIN